MITYLTVSGVAEYMNASVNTVKSWRLNGMLPAPDCMVGNVYGWLPSTIDTFMDAEAAKAMRKGQPSEEDDLPDAAP